MRRLDRITAAVARLRIANWRSQEVLVYNQTRKLGEVLGGKLYHGTTAELRPGDYLEPQARKNFAQSADVVSVTSDVERARYWAQEAAHHDPTRAALHVYEVEPVGEVEVWRVQPANYGQNIVLWEGRVPKAKVIREVS